ncbi:MAG: cytochrome c biogenesis protein ResB [Armatimonadota bacterium]
MAHTIEQLDEQQNGGGESKEIGALKALWDLFSSMKTAIVLLLVLAAVSIIITIVNAKKGDNTSNTYQSSWYLMLLTLVGINLAVCSINRFKQAWRRTFQPSLRTEPTQLKKAAVSESLNCTGTVEEMTEKVEKALRSRSYAVTKGQQDKAVVIHATKGRLAIWGPYLTHMSILVIFLGAVLGSRTGFDGYMTVTEGKKKSTYSVEVRDKDGRMVSRDVPLKFELGLRKFEIKHENHNPTGYKSDLQVFDGGKQVTQKVIDVNHPLTYKGITFFQSSYGLVGMFLKVTGPNGKVMGLPFQIVTESDEHGCPIYKPTPMTGEGMAAETLEIGGKRLTILAHNLVPDYVGGQKVSASHLPLNPAVQIYVNERYPEDQSMEHWQKLGWVPVNKSLTYKGFTITFDQVVQYTGLSVSRNPGLPVVYLGFGLLVLGIFISFYLTHKIIRVHIAPSGKQVSVVAGAFSRAEAATFDKDFTRLRSEVEA